MSFDGSFTIRPVRRLERPFIPSVDVSPHRTPRHKLNAVSLTEARLRQGKPGKGGKRCRKHRRNLSEEPSGTESPPGRVWPTAGSESCVLWGDPPGEA